MKFNNNNMKYDTEESTLLQEYFLSVLTELTDISLPRERTIGFERLLRSKVDGSLWRHDRFYRTSDQGVRDVATPMSENEARAWLKHRFGQWKRFRKLEERVFGKVNEALAVLVKPTV